ncbi:MAG: helix-turn-helix transcriptional regulator [Betaproteobacteria bacterium]|nr:helix-turn-helix transcriptional regulator [Betaproteobacteria bacterium]
MTTLLEKNISVPWRRASSRPDVAGMVESIVGCKWSLHVLQAVRQGVYRPGALQRSMAGLSTKVLNERLRKLARFGILEKIQYAEVPPRVEYHMTDFGRRFAVILDDIEALQGSLQEVSTP